MGRGLETEFNPQWPMIRGHISRHIYVFVILCKEASIKNQNNRVGELLENTGRCRESGASGGHDILSYVSLPSGCFELYPFTKIW